MDRSAPNPIPNSWREGGWVGGRRGPRRKQSKRGERERWKGWGETEEGEWRELEISRLTIKTCLRGLKKKLC